MKTAVSAVITSTFEKFEVYNVSLSRRTILQLVLAVHKRVNCLQHHHQVLKTQSRLFHEWFRCTNDFWFTSEQVLFFASPVFPCCWLYFRTERRIFNWCVGHESAYCHPLLDEEVSKEQTMVECYYRMEKCVGSIGLLTQAFMFLSKAMPSRIFLSNAGALARPNFCWCFIHCPWNPDFFAKDGLIRLGVLLSAVSAIRLRIIFPHNMQRIVSTLSWRNHFVCSACLTWNMRVKSCSDFAVKLFLMRSFLSMSMSNWFKNVILLPMMPSLF